MCRVDDGVRSFADARRKSAKALGRRSFPRDVEANRVTRNLRSRYVVDRESSAAKPCGVVSASSAAPCARSLSRCSPTDADAREEKERKTAHVATRITSLAARILSKSIVTGTFAALGSHLNLNV